MTNQPFAAIKTVFSYYPKEIRELIDKLFKPYPHEVFLSGILPDHMEELKLRDEVIPPIGGLNTFHLDIMAGFAAKHALSLPGLEGYGHRYCSAGSEEGIREYFTELARQLIESILEKSNTKQVPVYVFDAEYEGYTAVAASRGLKVTSVPIITDPGTLSRGILFVSNPSARDGNFLANELVNAWAAAGHKVFYDLSYFGSTYPHRYDLTHPNIVAVAVSYSKPYGLFYHRVGFLYSRTVVPGLEGNIWFKVVPALLIADAINRIDTTDYVAKYKRWQYEIVNRVNLEYGLSLLTSDSFLLAFTDADSIPQFQLRLLEPYRRLNNRGEKTPHIRVCLTRWMLGRDKFTACLYDRLIARGHLLP